MIDSASRALAAIIFFGLVSVGCGSTPSVASGETLAFEDGVAVASEEAQDLGETNAVTVDVVEADDLISFQATWLCELARRTFPDPSAADAALEDALSASGFQRSEYDGFVESLASSQELRDEVLGLFVQRCNA